MTISKIKADEERCYGGCTGFTLVEVLVAVAVIGVMTVSLFAGFSFGFAEVRRTREDERATQILQEKMDIVRLLSWNQLVNLSGYVPTNFTEVYYATNPTNTTGTLPVYTGTVAVLSSPVTESYSNDLRAIQITLTWQSGTTTHQRKATTFVSQYGLQSYIY